MARKMFAPSEFGDAFQKRYFDAIQRDPAVVMEHAELARLFANEPSDAIAMELSETTHEPSGPHAQEKSLLAASVSAAFCFLFPRNSPANPPSPRYPSITSP